MPFEVEGGILLALVRALSVAALLSVFGTLMFRNFVAPRVMARMPAETTGKIGARLRLTTQLGVVAGVLAMVAWLVLQAADMDSAISAEQVMSALPAVVSSTHFGQLVALQIAVLVAVAITLGRHGETFRQRAALGLAAIALALQAGHSHAASMQPESRLLLMSVVIHLLGAGAWLGGLLPLLLVVRDAPPKTGVLAAAWFSRLGKVCVATLVVSAGFQFWVLVAGIPGLVGTAYGWTVLTKLALFGILLAFAAANRYRFAPALLSDHPHRARRVLVASIAVQTGFGLAVTGAAAVLSNLPPAMHVQPIWPFGEQFSLDTVREDAAFRLEVILAILALAGAVALLVVAVLARRIRWPAVVVAAAIAWFAVPHLDLLLVQAYPTSFFHSPTGFAATSIVEGAKLFPQYCASCHGTDGSGDGPAAKSLPIPPADLTASHLWVHSDGELFWWLSHGIDAPEGGLAMPGLARMLSDDQRWSLIDYIRAHNAGTTMRRTGSWLPPARAPDLQATCGNRTVTLDDLRGQFVRLVVGPPEPEAGAEAVTIFVTSAAAPAKTGQCIADNLLVPDAYGIVSGISPRELAGTQFLIDGQGWLRAIQKPGETVSWNDPKGLMAEIESLSAHPIAASSGSGGPMNMKM